MSTEVLESYTRVKIPEHIINIQQHNTNIWHGSTRRITVH